MNLSNRTIRDCKLHNVLYVLKLSRNLLSIAKVIERGKIANFTKKYLLHFGQRTSNGCQKNSQVKRFYQLDCFPARLFARVLVQAKLNEDLWYQQYGQLNLEGLQKLAKQNMEKNYSFIYSQDLSFRKPCTEGNNHKKKFTLSCRETKDVLNLVHTDFVECLTQNHRVVQNNFRSLLMTNLNMYGYIFSNEGPSL